MSQSPNDPTTNEPPTPPEPSDTPNRPDTPNSPETAHAADTSHMPATPDAATSTSTPTSTSKPPVKPKPMSLFGVIKTTVTEFVADNAMTYAAAVSFYTALSFAPLLVVLLAGLSLILGDEARQKMVDQLQNLAGKEAAGVANSVLANADKPGVATVAGLIGLATLIFSATGVFAQLQQALNAVWEVKANPRNGLIDWMRKRLLSLGSILAIGFLLLISLVISAAIQWFVSSIAGPDAAAKASGEVQKAPGSTLGWLWITLNIVISIGVFTTLFMFMFKYLPDVKIKWSDVWQGALVTAILFALGKWAIGKYLGFSSVGSAYGAAGSLVILLVWVYYSCVILFIGAEFTQVWTRRKGDRIQPADHAVALEPR